MGFFARALGGWFSKTSLSSNGKAYRLAARSQVARGTHRFTFELESPDAVLGLPVGHHLEVRPPGGSGVSRAYTPVTGDSQLGSFDLAVKVYPQGVVSTYLDSLKVGDTAEVAGPFGEITYKGAGTFEVEDPFDRTSRTVKCSHVGMIAGGTGITPMYQIAQYSAAKSDDSLEMSLLFANRTAEDIMLQQELESIAATCPRFRATFSVDKAPEGGSWQGGPTGLVSSDMLAQALGLVGEKKPEAVLICGPPGFHKAVKQILTEELSFPKDCIFEF